MTESILEAAATVIAAASKPAHQQIETWLEDQIRTGAIAPQSRLPTERDLAEALGVSRMTLRQSLGALELRGLITRKTGRSGGAFVNDPRFAINLTELTGLSARAKKDAGAEVITARAGEAPDEVAARLGLEAKALVFEITRTRSLDGLIICLERSYIRADEFDGFLDEDLTGSLFAIMADRGQPPVSAEERLRSVNATPEDAKTLGVPTGSALVLIERVSSGSTGRLLEFSRDLFRSDRVEFVVASAIGPAAKSRPAR